MKRIISVFVAALLLTILCCGCSNSDQSASSVQSSKGEGSKTTPVEDLIYSTSDNIVVIKGYTGNDTQIVLPDIIEGRKVYRIEEKAFAESNIESIIMPDTVNSIGKSAFKDCINLTSVQFSANLKTIETSAFNGCTSLTKIDLPESLVKIEQSAFSETALTTVEIPANVKSLNGFSYCENLREIKIPETVTEIGTEAFSCCSNLTKIEIPGSVTKIGGWAFYGTGLTEVTIPDSVTWLEYRAFFQCSDLHTVTMSSSLYENLHNRLNDGLREVFEDCPNDLTVNGKAVFAAIE